MSDIFLDTAFVIALVDPQDQHHTKATSIYKLNKARLVTTRAVFLESGNALATLRFRAKSVKFLEALEQDPNIEIVPISEDLYRRGFQLYQQYHDKEWGIVDCISFVVMRERKITEALTTDRHFQQAGFQTLL